MYGRLSFLRDTKRIGDIAEVRVLAALVEAGFRVLLPFGENSRYDLVIEREHAFYRVQVKSGRLRNGVVLFNCYSSHTHRGGNACRRYLGEADFFGVYCPDNDRTYLIPVGDVGTRGSLRIEPTKNAQLKKVIWADPYRIPGAGRT